jgi:hypothetical protein
LSVLVFALTAIVATAVDVAVARFMSYARSQTLSPSRWLLAGLAVILLGIPILSFEIIQSAQSLGAALSMALITCVGGYVIALRLASNGLSRSEIRERRAERLIRDRNWDWLGRRQRAQVRRLARHGQLQPDPFVAAIASKWAADTLASNHGNLKLARQITAAQGVSSAFRPDAATA